MTARARTSSQRASQAVPGRPLLIGNVDRVAPVRVGVGWATPQDIVLPAFAMEVREQLVESWAGVAGACQAGVVSYTRLIQHLMAHGAPGDFVLDATRALWDTAHHARLTLGMASAYAQVELTFGPIDTDGLNGPTVTVAETVDLVVREGCVGETVAAAQLASARDYAQNAVLRQLLARMADDAERHVALNWRLLKWLVSTHPQECSRLLPAFDLACADFPAPRKDPLAEVLRRNGRLASDEAHRVARNTLARVVRPDLAALADGVSSSTPVSLNIRSSG